MAKKVEFLFFVILRKFSLIFVNLRKNIQNLHTYIYSIKKKSLVQKSRLSAYFVDLTLEIYKKIIQDPTTVFPQKIANIT